MARSKKPVVHDAEFTNEQIEEAVEAETVAAPVPEHTRKFVETGTFHKRLNSQLRAVVMFDSYANRRWEFNLARQPQRDGVSIGPGLAMEMGLEQGDKVRVTLEKVA